MPQMTEEERLFELTANILQAATAVTAAILFATSQIKQTMDRGSMAAGPNLTLDEAVRQAEKLVSKIEVTRGTMPG